VRRGGGAVEAFGIYGLVAVLLAVVGALVLHRRHVSHGPRKTADGAGADTARDPREQSGAPPEG
jgi:hypothetical protein